VAWEDPAAAEARAARLLPGLMLARVDGKSPVEYLSEPQRAAVREAASALLQEPRSSLTTIAARWAQAFA